MKLIEGDWLYLIEDSAWNLKLGFSTNLYTRLYTYRATDDHRRKIKTPVAGARYWVLGVRPGTREEEEEFHKSHTDECILGCEFYPFKSRAAALLLLQNWQEPPMKERVIWTGEGPHYSLVHRKTTSDLASLLSRSRINKRGAAIVLEPCPYCGNKYGARSLRHHRYVCEARAPRKQAFNAWPYSGFDKCSHATETTFHQTGFHCPGCDAFVCPKHKAEHNKQFHPRPITTAQDRALLANFNPALRNPWGRKGKPTATPKEGTPC